MTHVRRLEESVFNLKMHRGFIRVRASRMWYSFPQVTALAESMDTLNIEHDIIEGNVYC